LRARRAQDRRAFGRARARGRGGGRRWVRHGEDLGRGELGGLFGLVGLVGLRLVLGGLGPGRLVLRTLALGGLVLGGILGRLVAGGLVGRLVLGGLVLGGL